MAKIAIIGAGGYVFPLRLIGDILSHPELRASSLALMDIDAERLRKTAESARELVAHHQLPTRLEATTEYGAQIIHAIETNQPAVIYDNVPNTNLISNLPQGCSVEVACLVDAGGIQPTYYGDLPPQCAAVNRTNINVQELAVAAALTGSVEHVYHAIALDPLTSALLNLEQIKAMTSELLESQAEWLPQFQPQSSPSLESSYTKSALD